MKRILRALCAAAAAVSFRRSHLSCTLRHHRRPRRLSLSIRWRLWLRSSERRFCSTRCAIRFPSFILAV